MTAHPCRARAAVVRFGTSSHPSRSCGQAVGRLHPGDAEGKVRVFDLHTHHDRCGHARGQLRDYVESALAQGLHTIGLSDHAPFFGEAGEQSMPNTAMAKREFAEYVAEAGQLRAEYQGRINILLGVESDFIAEHVAIYSQIFRRYPLDYVIGSVHFLDGLSLFDQSRWVGADDDELRVAKDRYCDLITQSARSGMFDILGHVDAVKAPCPRIADIPTPAVDRMLRGIADADVVIEVNTSGKTKECGGWYPSPEVLERASFHGVKTTFGSDAHDPYRVADEHEAVRTHLRSIGFREWYVFEQRKRISLPL